MRCSFAGVLLRLLKLQCFQKERGVNFAVWVGQHRAIRSHVVKAVVNGDAKVNTSTAGRREVEESGRGESKQWSCTE